MSEFWLCTFIRLVAPWMSHGHKCILFCNKNLQINKSKKDDWQVSKISISPSSKGVIIYFTGWRDTGRSEGVILDTAVILFSHRKWALRQEYADRQQMDEQIEVLIVRDNTKNNWQMIDGWVDEADPLGKVQGDWPAAPCCLFVGGFITVMDECRTEILFGCPDKLRPERLQFPVGTFVFLWVCIFLFFIYFVCFCCCMVQHHCPMPDVMFYCLQQWIKLDLMWMLVPLLIGRKGSMK